MEVQAGHALAGKGGVLALDAELEAADIPEGVVVAHRQVEVRQGWAEGSEPPDEVVPGSRPDPRPAGGGAVEAALAGYPGIARQLVNLFKLRFDPARQGADNAATLTCSANPMGLDQMSLIGTVQPCNKSGATIDLSVQDTKYNVSYAFPQFDANTNGSVPVPGMNHK
jgi:hypothetical protein